MKIAYDFRKIDAFKTLSDGEIRKIIERYILNDDRVNALISSGGLPTALYNPFDYSEIDTYCTIDASEVIGFIKLIELTGDTTVSVDIDNVKPGIQIKKVRPRMLYTNYSKKALFISFDALI